LRPEEEYCKRARDVERATGSGLVRTFILNDSHPTASGLAGQINKQPRPPLIAALVQEPASVPDRVQRGS